MTTEDEAAQPALSVVVPVWNERPWLHALLPSLLRDPNVAEVIVADNASVDGSAELSRDLGARVVLGGRPATGRNAGAQASGSDLLVFADADTVVTTRALQRVKDLFSDDQVVAVHFRLKPATRSPYVRAAFALMDLYVTTLSWLGVPQGVGSFLAVRTSTFARVRGFDESLDVGEDADLFRRLKHEGRVAYDRRTVVGVSARRFRLENPIRFSAKVLVWSLLRLLGSRAHIFRYRWQPYPNAIANQDLILLSDLSRGLERR